MAMAVVMGMATTVAVVSINNLQSSTKAQQAGMALNAADAGVAQAMSYLRSSGVRRVNCSPTCSANQWASATPTRHAGWSGGQAYKAWIEPVRPYPANDPAVYRIHSTGTASGAARRTVAQDVTVGSNVTRAFMRAPSAAEAAPRSRGRASSRPGASMTDQARHDDG